MKQEDFKDYPWLTEQEVNQLDLPIDKSFISLIGGISKDNQNEDVEWEELNDTAKEIILDVATKLTKLRFMGITGFIYEWNDDERCMFTEIDVDFAIGERHHQ